MNRDQMVAPFAEEELRQFTGRGGKVMTFIEDETVMDRLDAGYGYGNWQVQVDVVSEKVVKVRLGVRESHEWVWFEDFGYPNQDGGEMLKEAVSDGIRRCGRYVGIARDLYRKATYEPGGSLGPKPNRDAQAADPVQAGHLDNAHGTEREELMGRETKRGTIRKGTADGYKLEARPGPEGAVIGFRLEIDSGRNIPQVLCAGKVGPSLLAAYPDLDKLIGTTATVSGLLYNVRRTDKPGSWIRLHVDRFENADWILPADPDEPVPEGPDDSVSLVGENEAPTEPLGLVEEGAA